MPGLNGVELQQRLIAEGQSVPTIMGQEGSSARKTVQALRAARSATEKAGGPSRTTRCGEQAALLPEWALIIASICRTAKLARPYGPQRDHEAVALSDRRSAAQAARYRLLRGIPFCSLPRTE